jgi:hypothetical protein
MKKMPDTEMSENEGGDRERSEKVTICLFCFAFLFSLVAGRTIRCSHLVWSIGWLAQPWPGRGGRRGGERYTAGHRTEQKSRKRVFCADFDFSPGSAAVDADHAATPLWGAQLDSVVKRTGTVSPPAR